MKKETTTEAENFGNGTTKVKVRRTLEQEIEAAAAKLQKLQEKQREAQKRDREKNAKLVLELIKQEKMEDFNIAIWRASSAKIKETLQATMDSTTKIAKNSQDRK